MSKNFFLEYDGKVVQKTPNGYFRIELLEGPSQVIMASIANRLKSTDRRWRKITEGDEVRVEIPLGDLTKGRIIKLLN